ncbi:MAG TPA: DctP family TRAP transporter solute-binding subunit [Syntrophorhabdaceae bacterium]|nr:DctP family TRAP transporter solute-binding subunit [Syntrophorhabdaceae bacterium]
MKKTSMLNVLVVCLIGFALIAVGSVKVFAQEKQIKIRYATQLPATHLLTKAEFRMAKMIEERTKGRVKVEVYPGGQLYKAMELLKAVMSGAAEMGTTPAAMFTGPVPLLDVVDIPFLFNSYDDVVKLWEGEPGEMMRKQMERVGVKTIAFSAYGENMSFCSHKPLIKPEDFKGLKIRCNTNMGADLAKAFGASPVVFASAEVYEALQRKTIDCASSGVTSLKERKWYETTSHGTFTYAAYSLWPVMVNLKFFNSLPKDIQQVLIDVGKDHQAYVLKETAKEDAAAEKFIRTKLKVYELTAADKKAWADAGQKAVIDKWLKRTGADGKKTLEWINKNLKH